MKKIILSFAILSIGFVSYAQKSKKQVSKVEEPKTESIGKVTTIENNDASGASTNEVYLSTMKGLITKLFASKDIDGIESAGNNFERVAMAEPTEWLPNYYAAYAKIMAAFMTKDPKEIDAKIEAAEKLIQMAENITTNSELECLKGMCHQARIMVDPMSRGQQYSQMATESFNVSSELDPSNPRPYYMKANSAFYTPEQFGGGKKNS